MNFVFSSILLLFQLLSYIQYSNQQSVTYDFSILKRTPHFDYHIYLALLSKDDLCLGTPPQCEKVLFDPGVSFPVILNKEAIRKEGSYMKNDSSTYHFSSIKNRGIIENRAQKLIEGFASQDQLSFGPLRMDQWRFVLADNWIDEMHHSCIGLAVNDINSTKHNYFINKLYDNGLISTRQYSTELFDEYNGRLTFGDINVDWTSYRYLFQIDHHATYYVTRFYSVEQILIGNTIIKQAITNDRIGVHLDESFGLVQFPHKMKESIISYYLNGIECDESKYSSTSRPELDINFSYFLCNKKILQERAYMTSSEGKDDLILDFFENKQIRLRYEDMFIEFNDTNCIFAIIFKNDIQDPIWVIGQPVLKHYMLIRNYENDAVVFYEKLPPYTKKLEHCILLSINGLLIIGSVLIGFNIFKLKRNNAFILE